MNKPFTVACEDFKRDLTSLINNSGLPAFVLELVLHNYLDEICIVRQKQYQSDKAEYEEQLKQHDGDS